MRIDVPRMESPEKVALEFVAASRAPVQLALVAARTVATQLYGVKAADSRIIAGATLLLFAVGILASAPGPARGAR